jgi:hypothetical protein
MAHFLAYKSTTAGTNLTITQESYYSLINSIFTTEGVVGTGFIVEQTTSPSNQVKVNDGYVLVNSGQGFKYLAWQKNALGYELANIDSNSDPSNSRRDLIIYYINLTQTVSGGGGGSIVVVKGTPSASPVDPDLTAYENGTDKFAIPLARVTIPPSTININNGMITQSGNTNNSTVEPIRQNAYIENGLIEPNGFVELIGSTMTGSLQFSGTTNQGLRVNNLTTAQITALTANEGAVVYDTDTKELKHRDNTGFFGLLKNVASVITTNLLASSAVTTAKIANGAVTQEKLDSGIGYVPTPRLKCTRMYAPTQGNVTAEGFTLSGISFTANNLTADGLYASVTQAGTGNRAFTQPNPITRLDYEPIVEFRIRTASLTLGTQFAHWIGLFAVATPSDRISSGGACVAFRSNDNGTDKEAWTPVCFNGTTQTTGTAMTAVTVGTAYILRIRVVNVAGTYTAYFSVNGGTEQVINTNLPATSTGLYIVNGLSNQSGSSGGIIAELNSIYYEGK